MNQIDQNYSPSDEEMFAESDKLRQFYLNLGINEDDYGRLHMFFSPYLVPIGLTLRQCRICIELSYLRQEYVPVFIGNLFNVSESMTEEVFKRGMRVFLGDLINGISSWDFSKEPSEKDKFKKVLMALGGGSEKDAVRTLEAIEEISQKSLKP